MGYPSPGGAGEKQSLKELKASGWTIVLPRVSYGFLVSGSPLSRVLMGRLTLEIASISRLINQPIGAKAVTKHTRCLP